MRCVVLILAVIVLLVSFSAPAQVSTTATPYSTTVSNFVESVWNTMIGQGPTNLSVVA